jgi:hypothetical protein
MAIIVLFAAVQYSNSAPVTPLAGVFHWRAGAHLAFFLCGSFFLKINVERRAIAFLMS